MYTEFLKPFRRLYHLVGTTEDCQLIKDTYLALPDDKESHKPVQFVISETPNFQYKTTPSPAQGEGILPSYWLNKVLQREPMLLIAIFNLSKPLEPIEKWEDRLQTVHLQLNKIREYLRSYPHKKISTAVIILTPNATLFPMNKAREYLKIPERSLQILELQTLKTELKRIKSVWHELWQRQMEDKIKEKEKNKEEANDDTKLRGLIKLAVFHEILNNDDVSHYENAHFLCKIMYQKTEKGAEDIPQLLTLFELRFLGDVLFLKWFKAWVKSNPAEALTKLKSHFLEFKHKSLNISNRYMYYEEISWRSQLFREILNIVLNSGPPNPTFDGKIAELSKGIISYNIELFRFGTNSEAPSEVLERLDNQYFGRHNYKPKENSNFGNDFRNTRLRELMSGSGQVLDEAMDVIDRLRQGDRVKKHEEIYYSVFECRLHILQNNLEKSVSVFNHMIDFFLKKNDYFVLNCLLKDFQPLLELHAHHAQLVQFYLVAIKVSDHFNSLERLPEFVKEISTISSELKSPIEYILPKGSSLISIKVDYFTITSLLSDRIKIRIQSDINKDITSILTSIDVKFKAGVAKASDLPVAKDQTIQVEPSDYLTHEDVIEIDEIRLKSNNLVWIIKGDNITYLKRNRVFLVMPLNEPTVQVTPLFKKYYTNEAIPVEIKVVPNNSDTKVTCKVLFTEEKTEHPAMCFRVLEPDINLINIDTTCKVPENTPTLFYIKFPTEGDRKVKLSFQIQMAKSFSNSKGERKEVLKNKKHHQELKFTLDPMFQISKRFLIPLSQLLTKKIELKEGIYRLPPSENIMVQYTITAEEHLTLKEIKQEEQDNQVHFAKILDLKDVDLIQNTTLKVFSIITLKSQTEAVKLPPLFLRWSRVEHNIDNILIDVQEQLITKAKSLSIEFKEAEPFKKNEIGVVHYRVNNYLQNKIKVRVEALESDNLVVVGKNKTELNLAELSHTILTFKILPLVVGEIMLPELLVRVDEKIEAKLEKRQIVFVL